jgi:hypothetical protein
MRIIRVNNTFTNRDTINKYFYFLFYQGLINNVKQSEISRGVQNPQSPPRPAPQRTGFSSFFAG